MTYIISIQESIFVIIFFKIIYFISLLIDYMTNKIVIYFLFNNTKINNQNKIIKLIKISKKEDCLSID